MEENNFITYYGIDYRNIDTIKASLDKIVESLESCRLGFIQDDNKIWLVRYSENDKGEIITQKVIEASNFPFIVRQEI